MVLPQFEKLDAVLSRTFGELSRGEKWKSNYGDNKTELMPIFLKHLSANDLGQWGLNERLDELVEHIKKANKLPAPRP